MLKFGYNLVVFLLTDGYMQFTCSRPSFHNLYGTNHPSEAWVDSGSNFMHLEEAPNQTQETFIQNSNFLCQPMFSDEIHNFQGRIINNPQSQQAEEKLDSSQLTYFMNSLESNGLFYPVDQDLFHGPDLLEQPFYSPFQGPIRNDQNYVKENHPVYKDNNPNVLGFPNHPSTLDNYYQNSLDHKISSSEDIGAHHKYRDGHKQGTSGFQTDPAFNQQYPSGYNQNNNEYQQHNEVYQQLPEDYINLPTVFNEQNPVGYPKYYAENGKVPYHTQPYNDGPSSKRTKIAPFSPREAFLHFNNDEEHNAGVTYGSQVGLEQTNNKPIFLNELQNNNTPHLPPLDQFSTSTKSMFHNSLDDAQKENWDNRFKIPFKNVKEPGGSSQESLTAPDQYFLNPYNPSKLSHDVSQNPIQDPLYTSSHEIMEHNISSFGENNGHNFQPQLEGNSYHKPAHSLDPLRQNLDLYSQEFGNQNRYNDLKNGKSLQTSENIPQKDLNRIVPSKDQKLLISPLYNTIKLLVEREYGKFLEELKILSDMIDKLSPTSTIDQSGDTCIHIIQPQLEGPNGTIEHELQHVAWVENLDKRGEGMLVPPDEIARSLHYFLCRVLFVAEALMTELGFDQPTKISKLEEVALIVRRNITRPEGTNPVLGKLRIINNQGLDTTFSYYSRIIAEYFKHPLSSRDQQTIAEYAENHVLKFLYGWYITLDILPPLRLPEKYIFLLQKISHDRTKFREAPDGLF